MPFIEHIPPDDPIGCLHREHKPPGMIMLPAGTHIYECPACKEKTRIVVPVRQSIVQEMQQEPWVRPNDDVICGVDPGSPEGDQHIVRYKQADGSFSVDYGTCQFHDKAMPQSTQADTVFPPDWGPG